MMIITQSHVCLAFFQVSEPFFRLLGEIMDVSTLENRQLSAKLR